MKFEPKSKEELEMMNLIMPGVYPFEVISAQEKMSRSGNEMIELRIKFWDDKGQERYIYDYLLEKLAFKLRHFTDVVGLSEKYQTGQLSDMDCVGKSGHFELIIQKGQDKQDGTRYPDKNSVKDYIVKAGAIPQKIEETFFNDDIPF